MIELLKTLNYKEPDIKPLKIGNLEVTYDEISKFYSLFINGEQWMKYNTISHEEAYDVYSMYYMAKGHCVCTGMGFGSRENWLLTKDNVTKLTIIEKNIDVIKYHETINSKFLNDKRVNIINMDASDFNGDCDCLFLDHYEMQGYEEILYDVKKIHDQSNFDILWFWPFEKIIMHSRKWHTDNDQNRLITKYESYNLLKHNHGLYKMPELNSELINLFCFMFNSKLFSKSEWFLENYFNDKHIYHELYRNI